MFNDAPLAVRARLGQAGWGSVSSSGHLWLCSAGAGLAKVWRAAPRSCSSPWTRSSALQAELLFRTDPRGLLFATLIQQNNSAARAVWVRITARHQAVVRSLLNHLAACCEESAIGLLRTG